MTRTHKKPSVLSAIMPIVLTMTILVYHIFVNGGAPHIPLILGISIAAVFGLAHGFEWADMQRGLVSNIAISVPVMGIMMAVGMTEMLPIDASLRLQESIYDPFKDRTPPVWAKLSGALDLHGSLAHPEDLAVEGLLSAAEIFLVVFRVHFRPPIGSPAVSSFMSFLISSRISVVFFSHTDARLPFFESS